MKAVLGVRPGRGVCMDRPARSNVVVGVTLAMSWILTWLLFGFGTDWGAMYEDSLRPQTSTDTGYEAVGGAGYRWSWSSGSSGYLQLEVYPAVDGVERAGAEAEGTAGQGVVTMWAGKLEDLPNAAVESCREGREGYTGYALGWRFEDPVADGVKQLRGEDAALDCRVLFSYEPSYGWAPYARDVVQDIPRGALPPLIGMVLAEAAAGGRQVDESVELGEAVADGLTRRMADAVTDGLDYGRVEQALGRIALMYGPIQFLALGMAFVSVLLLVASLWFWWARDSVEIAMNLIPYHRVLWNPPRHGGSPCRAGRGGLERSGEQGHESGSHRVAVGVGNRDDEMGAHLLQRSVGVGVGAGFGVQAERNGGRGSVERRPGRVRPRGQW